jgi:hypothetical protein
MLEVTRGIMHIHSHNHRKRISQAGTIFQSVKIYLKPNLITNMLVRIILVQNVC